MHLGQKRWIPKYCGSIDDMQQNMLKICMWSVHGSNILAFTVNAFNLCVPQPLRIPLKVVGKDAEFAKRGSKWGTHVVVSQWFPESCRKKGPSTKRDTMQVATVRGYSTLNWSKTWNIAVSELPLPSLSRLFSHTKWRTDNQPAAKGFHASFWTCTWERAQNGPLPQVSAELSPGGVVSVHPKCTPNNGHQWSRPNWDIHVFALQVPYLVVNCIYLYINKVWAPYDFSAEVHTNLQYAGIITSKAKDFEFCLTFFLLLFARQFRSAFCRDWAALTNQDSRRKNNSFFFYFVRVNTRTRNLRECSKENLHLQKRHNLKETISSGFLVPVWTEHFVSRLCWKIRKVP